MDLTGQLHNLSEGLVALLMLASARGKPSAL